MSDSEAYIRKQLSSCFGTEDVYEVLGIAKSASSSEIKKAYMKLALVHHPDKGGDKEKFQALSLAHAILSDEEKRRLYDETGVLDESNFNEESFDFWYAYFRNLFPKIQVADIESFGQSYVGSEEEKRDIVSAFQTYKGDLKKVMNSVMFAEAGEEQRIISTIDQAISEGLLSATKLYSRMRTEELQRQSRPNGKRKRDQTKEAEREVSLVALMKQRSDNRSQQESVLAKIMSKYTSADECEEVTRGSKPKKRKSSTYNVDDDEFEQLQREMIERRNHAQRKK